MLKLTLRGWLVAAVALLLVCNVAWRLYAGWGLVTLRADRRPLREVVASIERQAHVTLRTNLEPTTPVTLRFERMPVADALERLAAVTDARWRLAYAVAPDAATARRAFTTWVAAAGTSPAPDGWRWFDHRMPPGGGWLGDDNNNPNANAEPGIGTPDPRRDVWRNPGPAAPAATPGAPPAASTLHAFLDQGSNVLDAAFLTPTDWNPAVTKSPDAGPVDRVASRLASAAGGRAEEAFLLMKNGRRGNRPGPPPDDAQANTADAPPPPDGADRPDRGRPGDRLRRAGERMQARIDNLPPDQRPAAQARFNAEREFWQSLRDLSPEDRRAKMEDRMNDPARQDRMMERGTARESLLTPEQRVDRYRTYVQRREEIKNR